jgi:hypothetical protein
VFAFYCADSPQTVGNNHPTMKTAKIHNSANPFASYATSSVAQSPPSYSISFQHIAHHNNDNAPVHFPPDTVHCHIPSTMNIWLEVFQSQLQIKIGEKPKLTN